MADEPVDEIYGSEDLPYNFRFASSPAIESLSAIKMESTAWKSHTGPTMRPVFMRHAHAHHEEPYPVNSPSTTSSSVDSSSITERLDHLDVDGEV